MGWLENAVLPVGCEPKSASEKVEPVVEDVAALVGDVEPKAVDDVVSGGTGGLPVTNEDATLVKVVTGAPVC